MAHVPVNGCLRQDHHNIASVLKVAVAKVSDSSRYYFAKHTVDFRSYNYTT